MDYLEVEDKIRELLQGPTSMTNCEKLAALYSVMDHRDGNAGEYALRDYEDRQALKMVFMDDEFCRAVNGKNAEEVIEIIDQVMHTIKTTAPSTHDMIVRAIMNGV